MKKFNLFIFLSLASLATSFAKDGSDMKNSFVFLHTLRNTPTVSINNVQEAIKHNTALNAKNIIIDCKQNQESYIALANRTIIGIGENSKIEIEDFSQSKLYSIDFDNDMEESVSNTKIKLSDGKFYFTTLRKNSESNFKIQTPSALLDIDSKKFAINVVGDKTYIYIFDGHITLKNTDKHSTILRNAEKAIATKDEPKVEISYHTPEDSDSVYESFLKCRFVFDTTIFELENDSIKINRIIPRELQIRKTKY